MHQQAPNMVQTKVGALLHLILCLCVHALSPIATATAAANGNTSFSIELIHRDSIRSPFYSANLTNEERYKRLGELSDARLQMFKSLYSANLTAIRPPVDMLSSSYMTRVTIGTGHAARDYYLLIDTGSELTWTQCKPCDPCFVQSSEVFVPANSPTNMIVALSHPLCKPPYGPDPSGRLCAYTVTYGDGGYIKGLLSQDTFGFTVAGGTNKQSVPNMLFGCTHSSRLLYNNGVMAGLLSLNGKRESFAVQLSEAGLTNGRFSYCLVPQNWQRQPSRSGYLRFGGDIPMHSQVQQTPLTIAKEGGHYYLTLLDISVNRQRLKLDKKIFKRRADGSGGVVIDSGSYNTRLVGAAYQPAKKALIDFVAQYGVAPVHRPGDLCFPYSREKKFEFPLIALHLDGAIFEVPGGYLFKFSNSNTELCWVVKEDDTLNMIGNAHQVYYRFTYDINRRALFFAPEDCRADA